MNHIIKFNQFVNEAELIQVQPKVEKKPEYWNWEREKVVNAILDQGLYKDRVAKSLATKLTSTDNSYTYGMLEPEEEALFDKLLGKKAMDPTKRMKFFSIG